MDLEPLKQIEVWLHDPLANKLLLVFIVIASVYAVYKLVLKSTLRFIKENQTKYYVTKILKFACYLFVLIFVAFIFSDKLQGLSVAMGVAGVGVAFALKEVIASAAGWSAIAFGSYYRTGDRVQLGGIRGDVIDIGILRTTIMECGQWVNGDLYTGRVVRVANSFVFSEPVYNYSGDFPFLWDELTIPIKFGSDHKLVRQIIYKVADEVVGEYASQAKIAWKEMVDNFRIEKSVVDPIVTLVFNDNWIEFTLRYVVDYKLRRSTKDLIFSNMLDQLALHKETISLASTTFEVVGLPKINLNLK